MPGNMRSKAVGLAFEGIICSVFLKEMLLYTSYIISTES